MDERPATTSNRAATEAPDAANLTAYIVDEIARALSTHERANPTSVQRILPLGEMLALFNLADQFGLIDQVRAALDRRRGANTYLAFSEAMKDALLDRGFSAEDPPAGRPMHPRESGSRPAGGRQGRADGRSSRGGRRGGPPRP